MDCSAHRISLHLPENGTSQALQVTFSVKGSRGYGNYRSSAEGFIFKLWSVNAPQRAILSLEGFLGGSRLAMCDVVSYHIISVRILRNTHCHRKRD